MHFQQLFFLLPAHSLHEPPPLSHIQTAVVCHSKSITLFCVGKGMNRCFIFIFSDPVRGRGFFKFAEILVKIDIVSEAALDADLLQGQIGIKHQLFGGVQPLFRNIRMRSFSGFLFERIDDMRLTITDSICDLMQRGRCIVLQKHIGKNFLHNGALR